MKGKWKFIIKAFISIIILGVIYKAIPFEEFSNYEFNLNTWYLIPVIIIGLLNVIVITYKWQIIIKQKSSNVPFSILFKLYFLGNFFGVIAPVIAGDGIRAYKLSKYIYERMHSVTSVLWARVTGMVALMILAAISLPFVTSLGFAFIITTSIIIFFSLACFMILIVCPQRISYYIDKLSAKYGNKKIIKLFVSAVNNIVEYSNDKSAICMVLLLSIVDHLTRIACSYFLSISLGYNVNFYYFLIFMPIAFVVQMIPVSLGGIGVREGIYLYLFSKVGLTSVEAISLSIFTHIVTGIFYLPGLYFFLYDRKSKNTQTKESCENIVADVG